MPSRRRYSRHPAMAAKRDTDTFQRMHRRVAERWDDDAIASDASTYWLADERGPDPVPEWVITADAAGQADIGLLKTGKEADVHVVERWFGDQVNVLAAKRYRNFEDRLFRDDARYRAARRTGDRRVDKAMDTGSSAGMAFRARLWVDTEWAVLCRLWAAGVAVPYPVQKLGSEIMLELVGSDGEAAPRLVHADATSGELADLWEQLVAAMRAMVRAGVVHGDLSPYNLLVRDGVLVVIDLPQAVDPIAHPEGMALLERDVANVCAWFARRGVACDASTLFSELLDEALS